MHRQNTKEIPLLFITTLANTCNVQIIRIYGATGHGKGLVNAMSSFGVKSILRRDIAIQWFQSSSERCSYLQFRGGKRMFYINIDENSVDSKRMNKNKMPIKNFMMQHLLNYKANNEKIFIRESIFVILVIVNSA